MRRNRLGATGLEVSAIGLGTVELGLDYGAPGDTATAPPEEREAARLLNRALDAGINYIDTARLYGNSEEVIGRAISHRRGEFILASKVFHWHADGLRGKALRERVFESIHRSLGALRTDVIDVMMIHSAPREVVESGEISSLLEEARRAGLIRFTGASVYGDAGLAALHRGGYDCLQIAYNVLDREPECELIPLAARHSVGLVIRSVLLKGALTSRHRDLPEQLASLRDAAQALQSLAGEAGMTLPELAYRYVLAHPGCAAALVGTGRLAELEDAIRYAEAGGLPEEVVKNVRRITVTDSSLLNPGNWRA